MKPFCVQAPEVLCEAFLQRTPERKNKPFPNSRAVWKRLPTGRYRCVVRCFGITDIIVHARLGVNTVASKRSRPLALSREKFTVRAALFARSVARNISIQCYKTLALCRAAAKRVSPSFSKQNVCPVCTTNCCALCCCRGVRRTCNRDRNYLSPPC